MTTKLPLHHVYIKNDKPLLVMLHGLLSSHETFVPLIDLLEPHFSLLLVDQRGHGKSPAQGLDYSAEAMAQDLKHLIDSLHIKEPFTLLGHSMGARSALMFGALFPNLINKMIVEDMGIHQRQERSPERDLEKEKIATGVKVNSLIFHSKDEIFRLISPLFSYANELLTSKVVEKKDGFELKFWPDVSVRYGYQGNYSDLTHCLVSTQFPVMFIVADFAVGSAMTQKCIDHIITHVPRAKFHYIPKSWHNIHKTHPKEFTLAIIDFFNEKIM